MYPFGFIVSLVEIFHLFFIVLNIFKLVNELELLFDCGSYQKVRGSTQTGEVPSTYRCYKCQKMGHWIKNCPQNAHHESSHTEIRRSTGIPRSFIDGMRLSVLIKNENQFVSFCLNSMVKF